MNVEEIGQVDLVALRVGEIGNRVGAISRRINESVAAGAAGQRVDTAAAVERVVPGVAGQGVIAQATENLVVGWSSVERVVARRAGEQVGENLGAPSQRIDAMIGGHRIVYIVVLVVAVEDRDRSIDHVLLQLGDGQQMAAHLERQLLHVGNQPCHVRGGLAGARFGDRSAVPACAGDLPARREDRRHCRAALGEGGDAIGTGRIIDRPPGPCKAAGVAIPYGADRPGVRVGGRRGHALGLITGVIVAGRHDDGRIVGCQGRDLTGPRGCRGTVLIVTEAERHVHGDDVVGRAIADHPVQRFGDVGSGRSTARVGKDLERDDVHARRHPAVDDVLRPDDAGDIGAVPVVVRGVGIV